MQRQQLPTVLEPEREPDDMRAIRLQRVEKARTSRLLPAIGLGVVRLAALARAAGIEGDDTKVLLQVGDPAGFDPALQAGGAAMQQHDRLAPAAVDVVDLHTVEIGILAVVGREGRRRREAKQRRGA